MANIKKDNKLGTYYFVLSSGKDPLTNKRRQYRRSGFQTKEEAELALAKLKIEISEADSLNPSNMCFEQFLESWFEPKKLKLQLSTISNYEQQIESNILPFLGKFKLYEINENVLQNYIVRLKEERKLAPATIRTAYGIVTEVLALAMRKKLINPIYFDEVSLPPEEKHLRVWDKKEIEIFLDARNLILDLSRYYVGYEILLQTGMRRGEVLALRWKDIDFDQKLIRIRQTLGQVDKNANFEIKVGGKTQTSVRSIYIHDSLIKRLLEQKEVIEREKRALGDNYMDMDLVVCTKHGHWVHPHNFGREFRKIVKSLNLPSIRLHDLRHTHATFLMSKGINPKIVQERLGHKNIKITLQTYSHVLPSMQIEAASKFDEIFG